MDIPLPEHSTYTTIFNGIDIANGEIVVINEWSIDIKNNSQLTQVMKQVSSIEQEFNHLVTLKHQNLARYFSIKCSYSSEKVVVYILKEFIYGTSNFPRFVIGSGIAGSQSQVWKYRGKFEQLVLIL